MHSPFCHYLLTQAYNNAWSNHRLLRACAALTQDEFCATRTSFFPTIRATLNHILTVDWMYVDALEREAAGREPHPDIDAFFSKDEPFDDCASLRAAQRACDERLIACCAALDEPSLGRIVQIWRGDHMQRDTRARLLAHVFQHQIHHRGQVHAMLAGTSVPPPQLDEFFSAGEADLRLGDFRELGWTEEMIWPGEHL